MSPPPSMMALSESHTYATGLALPFVEVPVPDCGAQLPNSAADAVAVAAAADPLTKVLRLSSFDAMQDSSDMASPFRLLRSPAPRSHPLPHEAPPCPLW